MSTDLSRSGNVQPRGSSAIVGLTHGQRKNLGLAALGTLLEFYEFMLFGFFTVVIGELFFPADMPGWMKEFQTFAIFALGYLVRPLSGTVIGHLGDKFGRKKLFMFTIFMMALPTTLMGLLPTYAQIGVLAPILLLLLRLVQGLAVAGETAGSSVFVAEHVPGSRMGRAAGWLFGSTYLGYFLGAAAAAIATNLLDPDTLASVGWRVLFIIGGVFGFVAVYLRRHLDETPMFEEIRRTKDRAKAFPFAEVLKSHRGATLYVIGLAAYIGATIITLYFYLPSFLQTQYGVPRPAVFNANASALLLLALLCPVWGWISDRIGFGQVLALGAVGTTVVTIGLFQSIDTIGTEPGQLLGWYLAISVFVSTVAVIPAFAALVFPTEVRFTGFAFGYNVGAAIFAGTTPIILSWVVLSWGKTAVLYYVVAVGLLGVVLGLIALRLRFYPKEG